MDFFCFVLGNLLIFLILAYEFNDPTLFLKDASLIIIFQDKTVDAKVLGILVVLDVVVGFRVFTNKT
jgi:hypothetical protein